MDYHKAGKVVSWESWSDHALKGRIVREYFGRSNYPRTWEVRITHVRLFGGRRWYKVTPQPVVRINSDLEGYMPWEEGYDPRDTFV